MEVKDTKKKKTSTQNRWFLPLSVVIICITTLSLYHKSVKNDFLDLDDTSVIVRNYSFLKDFSNAGQAFKQGAFQVRGEKDTLTSYYRPVMILSFMADAHISPSQSGFPIPAPFIKANIFYHVLACILLLLLLVELKVPPLPSLLLALIFAVHPLLNQAVAWIPGRNDSLLAIFILSSFISLLKYLTAKKNWMLVLHILFFLLALFTKENAVMIVLLVFLYLRFVNKEKLSLKLYAALGSCYAMCILPWFLLRQLALTTNAGISSISDVATTMLSNTPFFIQYLSKSILPFNLSVMATAADTNYISGLLAIVLLLAGILLSKKKNTALVMFGISWFLLFLLPSFFSSFSGLEHRAYLPLIGVIITASQIDMIKNADIKRLPGFILLAAIIIGFYALSLSRLPLFHDRFSFDKSAMEASPKSILPCLYLAQHYEQISDYTNAIGAYKEALKRDSDNDLAYRNMAGDYLRLNNNTEAEKLLRLDICRHPANAIAIFNLGLVVFQYDHKDSEGVALWKKSISIDSGFVQPYKVLSQYYQVMGDSSNTLLYKNLYIRKSPE